MEMGGEEERSSELKKTTFRIVDLRLAEARRRAERIPARRQEFPKNVFALRRKVTRAAKSLLCEESLQTGAIEANPAPRWR